MNRDAVLDSSSSSSRRSWKPTGPTPYPSAFPLDQSIRVIHRTMSSWYSNLTSPPFTTPNSRNPSHDSTHTACFHQRARTHARTHARTVARHALVPPSRPLPRPPPLRPPPPSTFPTPRTTANDHAPSPLTNRRRAARPRAPPAPQHGRHPTHPGTARTRDDVLGPRARARRRASP